MSDEFNSLGNDHLAMILRDVVTSRSNEDYDFGDAMVDPESYIVLGEMPKHHRQIISEVIRRTDTSFSQSDVITSGTFGQDPVSPGMHQIELQMTPAQLLDLNRKFALSSASELLIWSLAHAQDSYLRRARGSTALLRGWQFGILRDEHVVYEQDLFPVNTIELNFGSTFLKISSGQVCFEGRPHESKLQGIPVGEVHTEIVRQLVLFYQKIMAAHTRLSRRYKNEIGVERHFLDRPYKDYSYYQAQIHRLNGYQQDLARWLHMVVSDEVDKVALARVFSSGKGNHFLVKQDWSIELIRVGG